MCMNFTKREVAAILAVCVIASPVLLLYGVAKGGYEAAKHIGKAAQRKIHEKSEPEPPRASEELENAFSAMLQDAYTRAISEQSFAAYAELAAALFAKQDYYGAHAFFVKAEEILARSPAVPSHERAAAHYVHGLTLQLLGQFSDAVELFAKAADELPSFGVAVVAAHELPTVTRDDAVLQEVYCRYLAAMYDKIDQRCSTKPALLRDRDSDLRAVAESLSQLLSASPKSMRLKLLRAQTYFHLHINDPSYLKLAELDANEVYEWAKTATPEDFADEGIWKSDPVSLVAYILLARGLRKEGYELALDVMGGSGLDAFHADVSKDPELLKAHLAKPWPLRSSVTVDTTVEKHRFEQHFFKSPTWCDLCAKFISPKQNLESAFRCATCKYEVHGGDCLAAAQEHFCLATRDKTRSSRNVTHTHVFIEHRLHRVRACVVCGDSIMLGTTGAQCTACNGYAHKRCVEKSDGVSSPKQK